VSIKLLTGSGDEYFGLIIFTLKMDFKLDELNVLQIDFHNLNTQYSVIFMTLVFYKSNHQ